jgi:hypothetical protein
VKSRVEDPGRRGRPKGPDEERKGIQAVSAADNEVAWLNAMKAATITDYTITD